MCLRLGLTPALLAVARLRLVRGRAWRPGLAQVRALVAAQRPARVERHKARMPARK